MLVTVWFKVAALVVVARDEAGDMQARLSIEVFVAAHLKTNGSQAVVKKTSDR
jgi:hypothetical protein